MFDLAKFFSNLGSKSSITQNAYKELKNKKTPHTLIDVRETQEWDAGHIDGAIHIPKGSIKSKIESVVPQKDSLIVVYCASGRRSALAAHTLKQLGYTHVENLEGGYNQYID